MVLRTGSLVFQLPLLSISGIGIANWNFGLDYLSGNGVDGLLGKEFNYTQYEHLVEQMNGDIDLVTSHNTVERFTWNSSTSTYSSVNNKTSAELVRTGSGENDEFQLKRSGGSIVRFYGFDVSVGSGQLKSESDRFGNTLTYQWTAMGGVNLLDKVTDGYGREVNYSYCNPGTSTSSSSSSGGGTGTRLCEITDFLDRKLTFQYDSEGRLVAVVLPSILRAAEGNEYPGGTAYAFRYEAGTSSSSSSSSGSAHPDNLVNIWYPNQVETFLDEDTRVVDVDALYAAADAGAPGAAPRYTATYDSQRRVTSETVGDTAQGVGGTYTFTYSTQNLPENLIDPDDTIVAETVKTDRNGNETASYFNGNGMVVCKKVRTNRDKIEIDGETTPSSYDTWTKYNAQNQVLERVFPEGNSVVNEYDDGIVDLGSGPELYIRRRGLRLSTSRKPVNTRGINNPTRWGSGPTGEVQSELTTRSFYEPIYNRVCATIEERGNPIIPEPEYDANDFTIHFSVTGGATIDSEIVDGLYIQVGFENNDEAYARLDGAFWIWAGASSWRITKEKGVDGTGWLEGGVNIKGTYSPQGTGASGTATVVAAANYTVTGGATIDGVNVDGEYVFNDTINGERAYQRRDLAFWIWTDGSNWRITEEEGVDGSGRLEGGATILASGYTGVGTGSGTATVASTNVYWTPQNGGDTPTDADRSRFATTTFYDYQQNTQDTIKDDSDLQTLLGLTATEIVELINHVDAQMKETDGTGGLPAGFQVNLGDINGDGTGDGNSSGLDESSMLGSVVKIEHPEVRLLTENTGGGDPWQWEQQTRIELFTVNALGQTTTHTDPEGNVTAYVRYPYNDPEGDGKFIAVNLNAKQYGRMREVHVDVDPEDVMSLIGLDGDLVDFKTDVAPRSTRSNTPGVYQDLTTRYEGGMAAGGCSSCAYDPLGNALATTDPRGFTTIFERNEMGEVFRTISSKPYEYKVETYYDANRNVTREDTEDVQVQFDSDDPASAGYAHFTPTIDENAPGVAHVPTKPGPGGDIRPGWFTNLYTFDLLDNVIEEDIDATGSSPSSLVTSYEYDANENLILITKPEGNTVQYDYDERNLRIAEAVGNCTFANASSSSSSSSSSGPPTNDDCAVTIYFYDRNGNQEDVIGPAERGVAGNSLTATIEDAFGSDSALVHTGDYLAEMTYDGFDRTIQTTDAVGDVGLPTHDPGSRVIASTSQGPVGGTAPLNRDGNDNEDLASSETRFDEAGRAYESQQNVFLAIGTTVPSGRTITHTGGGLATNSTTNDHTATADLTATSPQEFSYVLSRTVHDAADRVVIQATDNAALTHVEYDGANRQIKVTDALNNTVENTYDGNSNVVHSKRTDVCTITQPTVDNEVFESDMYFDCLNRLVVSATQGADGTLSNDPDDTDTLFDYVGYDSRNNTVVTIDPKENTVISVYDGASRPTESHEHLRQLGEGDNPPAANNTFLAASGGTIRTITIYDGNSRVKQLVDDRGAPTNYTYDALDRQLTMVFQDGSTRSNIYNAASNVILYTDENGSVFNYTYDAIGRRTECDITPASGVAGHSGGSVRGTTGQTFQYDGLSRMTQSIDTTTVGGSGDQDAKVDIVYDALSRVLEDSQTFNSNDRRATNNAFTSFPVTQFTFPQTGAGGRSIDHTYDDLYRRTLVEESTGGADIASWQFFGPSRVAEVNLGNGLTCTHMNNARTHSAVQSTVANPGWGDVDSDRLGYDGAGRMITKRYLPSTLNGENGYDDTTAIVGATTAFDKASNKFFERSLQAESRSNLYQPRNNSTSGIDELGYDSIDRLRQYQRGDLNDGTGGGEGSVPGCQIVTSISLPNTDESHDYDLDGLGNWKKTVFTPQGGSEKTQRRDHNYLNQITRAKENSTDTDFSYDGTTGASNGNLANDGTRSYIYDALNRLVTVNKTTNATPTLIGTYTYDAMGRRIRKVVSNNGLSGNITNGTTDYVYTTGMQCCEERNGSNTPTKQYIWGVYIDELIQQRNDPEDVTPDDYYMLSDLLYRGTALTDDTGTIVEAYDTDAYGNTLIFSAAGAGGTDWWADDSTQSDTPTCEFIFTGRRLDTETEVYFYRARYYSPTAGRFISRDPIGYRGGLNLFEYTGGLPLTYSDPTGLGPVLLNPWDMMKPGTKPKFSEPYKNPPTVTSGPRWLSGGQWDVEYLKILFPVMHGEMADSEGSYWGAGTWFFYTLESRVVLKGVLCCENDCKINVRIQINGRFDVKHKITNRARRLVWTFVPLRWKLLFKPLALVIDNWDKVETLANLQEYTKKYGPDMICKLAKQGSFTKTIDASKDILISFDGVPPGRMRSTFEFSSVEMINVDKPKPPKPKVLLNPWDMMKPGTMPKFSN